MENRGGGGGQEKKLLVGRGEGKEGWEAGNCHRVTGPGDFRSHNASSEAKITPRLLPLLQAGIPMSAKRSRSAGCTNDLSSLLFLAEPFPFEPLYDSGVSII